MTIYLAYGSNMSRALMGARCPGARAIGVAKLDGWRFIITCDGYASIVPSPGASAYGVAWRVTPRDLAALNAYEALDSGLYHRRMLPIRCNGQLLPALTYVGRSHAEGRPRAGYQNAIVVPAARDWGLPPDYIAELARWSPGVPRHGGTSEPGALR